MTSRPALTVFIPAYNEGSGLAACVAVVSARVAELGVSAEILIVDDGSRDATPRLADELAAAPTAPPQPVVRVVHHPVNRGIGAAFATGVAQAAGEWLILIPADLAMDPADLGKYLAASAQADVVVGNRSDVRDYSGFRRLVHFANIALLRRLFGSPLHQFQYISLYRLDTLRQMDLEFTGSAFFLAEILLKAQALGARLVEVAIAYVPRQTGQATGARWGQITATLTDMARFWWRWVRLGPAAAARRRAAPAAANPHRARD